MKNFKKCLQYASFFVFSFGLSISSAGVEKNACFLLSENENRAWTFAAAVVGGAAGSMLGKGFKIRTFCGVGGSAILAGLTHSFLEKYSPLKRCSKASGIISKILDDDILMPVMGKKFKEINVQRELERHFMSYRYPLLSAKKYLTDINCDLSHVLDLMDSVEAFLNLNVTEFEKIVDSKPFNVLLDRVSWGFNGDVDSFFVVALKFVSYRFKEMCDEALLAVTTDVRFQEQYKTLQKDGCDYQVE